jgi:hypothetical protein
MWTATNETGSDRTDPESRCDQTHHADRLTQKQPVAAHKRARAGPVRNDRERSSHHPAATIATHRNAPAAHA